MKETDTKKNKEKAEDVKATSEEAKAAPEAEKATGAEQPAAEPEKKPEAEKAEKAPEAEKPAEAPVTVSKADYDALNDRYLRALAEYDNFRKRTQREKEALSGDIKADVLKQFLPVFDNLERALAQSTEDEAYRKGVEMIMKQFNTALEKLGVTEIESVGQTFDPALHNAIMHEEDPEKGENEVTMVFQKGFRYGDKVIRFAMVKVAN